MANDFSTSKSLLQLDDSRPHREITGPKNGETAMNHRGEKLKINVVPPKNG